MAHGHDSNTAVAEAPKTKTGTQTEKPKPATTVDAAEKAPKTPKEPKVVVTKKFRILDGVDVTKLKGQRQIIAKAMAEIGDSGATVEEIAKKGEALGLVAKTPLVATVKYHLGFMIKDQQVKEAGSETPAVAA